MECVCVMAARGREGRVRCGWRQINTTTGASYQRHASKACLALPPPAAPLTHRSLVCLHHASTHQPSPLLCCVCYLMSYCIAYDNEARRVNQEIVIVSFF